MRFNSLAYFRAYEDELVRGDPDDGKLQFKPADGLTLTKSDGEIVHLPSHRFRSSIRAEEIFVFCASGHRSEKLAQRFESAYCVEIKNPVAFLGRIRSGVRLRSRLDRRHVYAGPIDYRSMEAEPGAAWALPEKVAFIKPPGWSWQDEYRIVIGNKGAFDVENVELALETGSQGAEAGGVKPDPLTMNLGNLAHIAELHRF